MLGALSHQQLVDLAVIDRLDLHGRFISLDLGDHVSGAHCIALAHMPFDELAFLHGGRERGHQNLWHHLGESRAQA